MSFAYPLIFYSATDPEYRGYTVWFETPGEALEWRAGIAAQYGSSPNVTETVIPDHGALIAFLNREYNLDEDDEDDEDDT